MTDVQARTAVQEGDRFLLCVVPVDSDYYLFESADIWTDMRFVSGLGQRLAVICDDLGGYEDLRAEITTETPSGVQLEISPGPARVRVANSVWESDGFPLDELAMRLLA